MKQLIATITIAGAALGATSSSAGPADFPGVYAPNSEACYRQTKALERGVNPAKLKPRLCDIAIKRGPQTPEHRSAMLHNRALLEIAQGDLDKARESLEASVALNEEAGPSHIALAQLAAQSGDLERAAELYRELSLSKSDHPAIADNQRLFARNFERLSVERRVAQSQQ